MSEDARILARAVLEDHIEYNDYGSNYGYICTHCCNDTEDLKPDRESITHSADCPVLVAKDVLTGYPEVKDG